MVKMIKVDKLSKYFKELKAVDDISFSVEKGESFAFLGLNRTGKNISLYWQDFLSTCQDFL